jgi:superfamily II DNA/RNA helicase
VGDEEYNLYAGGGKASKKSFNPIFYETLIKIDLDEEKSQEFALFPPEREETYIKLFDAKGGKSKEVPFENGEPMYSLSIDMKDRNPRLAVLTLGTGRPRMKLAVGTKYREEIKAYEIELKLKNISGSGPLSKAKSYMSHAKSLLETAVFPHMYIETKNVELLFPQQQHFDRLISRLKDEKEEFEIARTYIDQINCIVTESTIKDETLIITPFGVFDTIRVNPKTGPRIRRLYENIDNFIKEGSELSEISKKRLREPKISEIVLGVMKAASKAFGVEETEAKALYEYQWVAIQRRLNKIFSKDKSKTVVIRAPTGAGKTLVFMVDALLHYLLTGERAVLMFPTRILNEDMFRRLTRLIYHLSQILPESNCTGGIFIGTKDPAYKALARPEIGKIMVQYDACPHCRKGDYPIIAKEKDTRKIPIGTCNSCGHVIDYMFSPLEVTDYLPAITIATPDKLFYELTYSKWSDYALRFIGAPVVKCECGYYQTLMGKKGQRFKTIECGGCGKELQTNEIQRYPVGYFVFDEVHSLYGLGATLISIFMNLIQKMMEYLGNDVQITYETGTATIANEKQLLDAITHRDIEQFPEKGEFERFFQIDPESVRYRTSIVLPVGQATMYSVLKAILNVYEGFHREPKEMKAVIKDLSQDLGFDGNEYDLALIYLLRKNEGYSLLKAVKDYARERGYQFRTDFLSGEFSTAQMVRVLEKLLQGEYQVILANMVISLGVDIQKLNNMIMMGVPKSVTEMIQTIGRTGRKLGVPGHITIHCLPSIPRDMFVYKNFQEMMGDVEGFFDSKPVQGTNAYAAEIILPNVVKGLISAKKADNYLLGMTRFASATLSKNVEIRNLFLDVMKVLVPIEEEDKFRDLRIRIGQNMVAPRIKDYVIEWGGTNAFLSDWFESQGKLLYGLRNQTDQVEVVILERALVDKVVEQYELNESYFDEPIEKED